MLALIFAPSDAHVVWPYSLAQLKQDNPNVSFSANPTADDLAPFDVFEVEPIDQPAHDPRTERVEEVEPTHDEHGWRQQWRIREATPEEVAAYDDANRPAPNWPTFKGAALSHPALKAAILAAFPIEPQAAMALSATLLRAEQGDPADFRGCWRAVCAAAPVATATVAELVALAERCQLPPEFVAALEPGT